MLANGTKKYTWFIEKYYFKYCSLKTKEFEKSYYLK